jgi:tetratricopeptide (TPR) repeat protein
VQKEALEKAKQAQVENQKKLEEEARAA